MKNTSCTQEGGAAVTVTVKSKSNTKKYRYKKDHVVTVKPQ